MDAVIVTGAAGFIGYHTARRLVEQGRRVIGVDSIDGYYDRRLKRARLEQLGQLPGFAFRGMDLADGAAVDRLLSEVAPGAVVHLAARPGVRASADEPQECIRNNVVAFVNVLESAMAAGVGHLVYASSSSVYGASSRMPYSEHDPGVGHPMSLYGASKRSNELMAHAYAHLYGLPVTGLRFFSVYGPWGRPDMAYFRFAEAIRTGGPITIFGDGTARRDLTYVDDIVDGLVEVLDLPPKPSEEWRADVPDPATSADPYRVYNIGHGRPITVLRMVELLEEAFGRTTTHVHEAPRAGDVFATESDASDLVGLLDDPHTVAPEDGLGRFADWYADYHGMVRR